jgi:hypothetical protein
MKMCHGKLFPFALSGAIAGGQGWRTAIVWMSSCGPGVIKEQKRKMLERNGLDYQVPKAFSPFVPPLSISLFSVRGWVTTIVVFAVKESVHARYLVPVAMPTHSSPISLLVLVPT